MLSRVLVTIVLVMSSLSLFAASRKDDAKDEPSPAKSESQSGTSLKWFHFNGDASNPSDLDNPDMYTVETAPECNGVPKPYLCDIQILTQASDESKPDLGQTPAQFRTRFTALD